MVVFQIMYGTYVALGNTITPLLGPNGYTPSQVSIIGVIFVFSGVVGCYLMGVFIDKTQRHLLGIRFVTIGLACLYMTATLILPPGIFVLTCVFGLLAGMFNVPILPATYSFATKITGNIPPAVVSGLMMSGAQLYCFIASVVQTWLYGYGQIYGLIFAGCMVIVAAICALCVRDTSKDLKDSVVLSRQSLLSNIHDKSIPSVEDSIEGKS